MRSLFAIVSLGFLSACATTAKYEAVLSTWVGKSENELVSKWGIPASTYPVNDGKMIMYQHDAGMVSTHLGYGLYSSNQVFCKTTFTLDGSGVIQNWRWEGNNCKAK